LAKIELNTLILPPPNMEIPTLYVLAMRAVCQYESTGPVTRDVQKDICKCLKNPELLGTRITLYEVNDLEKLQKKYKKSNVSLGVIDIDRHVYYEVKKTIKEICREGDDLYKELHASYDLSQMEYTFDFKHCKDNIWFVNNNMYSRSCFIEAYDIPTYTYKDFPNSYIETGELEKDCIYVLDRDCQYEERYCSEGPTLITTFVDKLDKNMKKN
jgi:hypothetical protein